MADVKGSEAIATLGGNAKETLKSIIERVERLEEEIKGLNEDKSEIYKEAKGQGFDKKALRAIVRMRAQDPDERLQGEQIIDAYMEALGMK